MDPGNHVLDGGPHRKGNFEGRNGPAQYTCPVMSGGTQSDSAVLCGCQMRCTRWGAHWRNMANTTEPSVCGDDAALCQITLTICCGRLIGLPLYSAAVASSFFLADSQRPQIFLYTVGHKKEANLFLSVTLSKINGF